VRDGEAVLGTYRRTVTPGDMVRITFEGLSLTLVPGPGTGEAEFSVDGSTPQRVSFEGRPVQLASDWRRQRHEITLTAVEGEVSIDEIIVRHPWELLSSFRRGS